MISIRALFSSRRWRYLGEVLALTLSWLSPRRPERRVSSIRSGPPTVRVHSPITPSTRSTVKTRWVGASRFQITNCRAWSYFSTCWTSLPARQMRCGVWPRLRLTKLPTPSLTLGSTADNPTSQSMGRRGNNSYWFNHTWLRARPIEKKTQNIKIKCLMFQK